MVKYYFIVSIYTYIYKYGFYLLNLFLFFSVFICGFFFFLSWVSPLYTIPVDIISEQYTVFSFYINFYTNFYLLSFSNGLLFLFILYFINKFYKNYLLIGIYIFYYLDGSFIFSNIDLWFFNWMHATNPDFINTLVHWHPLILFITLLFVVYLLVLNKDEMYFKSLTYTYLFYFSMIFQNYLILSLVFGSWWAAQELNWGLWWNWDIVEVVFLICCFWLSFSLHINILFLNKFWFFNFFISSFLFNVNYFFLTKIDLFSSIHTFNNIFFLQKWFDLMVFYFIGLHFLWIFFFFFYMYTTNNFIFFIFCNFINIYASYYIYLLIYKKFLFIENFYFFKIIFIYINLYYFITIIFNSIFFLYNFLYSLIIKFFLWFWINLNLLNRQVHLIYFLLGLVLIYVEISNSLLFFYKLSKYELLLNFYQNVYFCVQNKFFWIIKTQYINFQVNIGIILNNFFLLKNLLFLYKTLLIYFVGFFNFLFNFFQFEFFLIYFIYFIFLLIMSLNFELYHYFFFFKKKSDII